MKNEPMYYFLASEKYTWTSIVAIFISLLNYL